jgi:hypothetical protein
MNDEQRMDQQLRDFYLDDQVRTHDRGALLREILDTVHDTPQQRRRRWWPFRRHAALTSPLPGRELQPDLTSVTTNGQAAASGGSTPLLYGAFKFVVATAIVALFGGFLLFGVLAPQEPTTLPGASSSASPETSAKPSETTMDLKTPVATMAAVLATMAPGTGVAAVEPDFVAEQVEAGVERIVSDGADFDQSALPDNVRYAFEDIAVSPSGDVYVVGYRYHTDTGRTEGPFVMELGTPGETGTQEGFPVDFEKIVIDANGDLVVASPSGIKRLVGEAWVDSPGTLSVQTGGGTIWLAEPGDVSEIGPGSPTDHRGGVLTLSADYAGYAVGDEVGYRFVKDWPTWWESCSEEALGYRSGTGCDDRGIQDDRGVGAGHDDDENRSLFLADVSTRRIAAPPDGTSVWVLGGPGIDDLWSGRSTENGAIYRIDKTAPGFECSGC